MTLLVAAVLVLLVYRGTQHVPDFYIDVLNSELTPQEQAKLGDDFEREALELHNDAKRVGAWEAVFSEDQVNAWLANDLPRNHPRALPSEVSDPGVKISPDQVQVGCMYSGEPIGAVISLSADVYLTDKPNQLAIQVHSVRAGRVPLPLKNFMDRVSEATRTSGLQLVWSRKDGDPVALIQIPSQVDRKTGRKIRVETLELRDGEVYVAGRTDRSGR